MQLNFVCPGCQQRVDKPLALDDTAVNCSRCGWDRPIRPGDVHLGDAHLGDAHEGGQPAKCLVCGCGDLWRQKNFPQGVGLLLVALGALLSTVAWSFYLPKTALGVLLAFALADVLLYTFMRDMLVCYRCRARYANTNLRDDHPRFNLETAERYRQEAARVANAIRGENSRPPAVSP